jgi:RNA polymerase sigma-70 factor, ECF subfamily
MTELDAGELGLVAAAAGGDEEAFRRLVEPIRSELHLHCYRMTGSFHDAEDVLQDAHLKAWRGLTRYDGRASFRTWMYRVVTNTCLDALRSRGRRVLPRDVCDARDPASGLGAQRHDIHWLEPYPDAMLPHTDPAAAAEQRESVRLAFIWALQILPARQRAVLILRDVLDWTAGEVSVALGTTVAAVNSALQRARATVARAGDSGEPAIGAAAAGNAVGAANSESTEADSQALGQRRAEMANRYVRAWESGDLDAVVAMLTEDALHSMPPWPAWYVGRHTLRELYAGYPVWDGQPGPGVFRILPTALNGDLAFAEYCRERPGEPYRALALTVAILDANGSAMVEKVSFVDTGLMVRMGFPEALE